LSGTHWDPVDVLLLKTPHHPPCTTGDFIDKKGLVRHTTLLQRSLWRHLIDPKSVLHQRQHPLAVECDGHHSRRQPALPKPPQRVEEWLQFQLVLFDDAVRPVVLTRHQDLAGEPRQPVVIVAQVEPPVMPAAVRRDELRRDVLLTSTHPNLESAAPRMHRAPHSSLARLLEEVEPQIPVWLHPQVPLADRRKDGILRDGVGAR
jgi:hypothetical protein